MIKRKIQFVAAASRITVEVRTKAPGKGDFAAPKGLTVDLQPVPVDAVELSITGECTGSAGQCVDSIRESGNGNADVERLCDIWERWHLNGMRAGTRAQTDALESYPTTGREFGKVKAYLAGCGLDPDNGYSYGSQWLFEPVPVEVLQELDSILDRLDGARIGEVPALNDAPEIGGDTVDSRDVVARLEIFRVAVETLGFDPETVTDENADIEGLPDVGGWCPEDIVCEFVTLRELDSEGSSYASDWNYGATLINESYFEKYMDLMLEDIGEMPKDIPSYLTISVNYDALKKDYTPIEYKGETYWVR